MMGCVILLKREVLGEGGGSRAMGETNMKDAMSSFYSRNSIKANWAASNNTTLYLLANK